MFNKLKFKSALALRDMTANQLAGELGITAMGLSRKVVGKRQFTLKEIAQIQKILGLTKEERDDIFFED